MERWTTIYVRDPKTVTKITLASISRLAKNSSGLALYASFDRFSERLHCDHRGGSPLLTLPATFSSRGEVVKPFPRRCLDGDLWGGRKPIGPTDLGNIESCLDGTGELLFLGRGNDGQFIIRTLHNLRPTR